MNIRLNMRAGITALLSTAVLSLSPAASAQIATDAAQETGYVGLLLGYTDSTNIKGTFGYGAEAGLRFASGLTGLVYFLNSDVTETGTKVQLMHYGAGVDYALSGLLGDSLLGGLKAGVKLGMGTLDVEGADGQSDFSAGVGVGYDYVVAYGLSLGVQSNLIWTFGDSTMSTLYLLGTVKLWF